MLPGYCVACTLKHGGAPFVTVVSLYAYPSIYDSILKSLPDCIEHLQQVPLPQLGLLFQEQTLFQDPAWGSKMEPTLQTSWSLSSKKRAAKRKLANLPQTETGGTSEIRENSLFMLRGPRYCVLVFFSPFPKALQRTSRQKALLHFTSLTYTTPRTLLTMLLEALNEPVDS